jgi:hypothetical protein
MRMRVAHPCVSLNGKRNFLLTLGVNLSAVRSRIRVAGKKLASGRLIAFSGASKLQVR